MSDQALIFDVNRPISMRLRSPDGDKQIAVRFPTDDEWIDRQARRKIVTKSLGRGKTQTVPADSSDADSRLVAEIRTDAGGPELDEYESTQVLDRLARCEVDEVVRDGDGYRVALRVPGGTTAIGFRTPSAKEQIKYRRKFVSSIDLRVGKSETTVNLRAVADLDKLIRVSSEGYAGDAVPIVHRAIALNAMIEEIESGNEADDSENF